MSFDPSWEASMGPISLKSSLVGVSAIPSAVLLEPQIVERVIPQPVPISCRSFTSIVGDISWPCHFIPRLSAIE